MDGESCTARTNAAGAPLPSSRSDSSTNATCAPACAADSAADRPLGPPPITSTSQNP